jgi:hypothetical protein
MAVKFANTQVSEGTVYGFTVTDKIGFFGTTAPSVQLSGMALVTNVVAVTGATAAWGFATSAQAADALTMLRFLYSAMITYNLMK